MSGEKMKEIVAEIVEEMSAAFAVANRSEAASLIMKLERLNAGLYGCTPIELRRERMKEPRFEHLTEEQFFRQVICGLD